MRISLKLSVIGMALLEVALDSSIRKMSLLCLKHSEGKDMGGLCFEQFTRYVEFYTSRQPMPSAYRISGQGECWLGVTEVVVDFNHPSGPHTVNNRGL